MKEARVISVIGPNASKCTTEIYEFGLELGKTLIDNGFIIACGGRFGIMEAVCKGAKQSKNYSFGKTIGIIPSSDKNDANSFCDIVIPTGMGIARNAIVVNTGDVVIAIAGGSGTLSEIAMAWQLGKKIICYTGFDGWSKKLAGIKIDNSNRESIVEASSLKQIMDELYS